MVELLYLTHNRREFVQESLRSLEKNTEWDKVSKLWLFDDHSEDGTLEIVTEFSARSGAGAPLPATVLVGGSWGSPIPAMNEFFQVATSELVVRIDSDAMVPPGWLGEALEVMERSPEVDLLGIESGTRSPGSGFRVAIPTNSSSAVGIFRLSSVRKVLGKQDLSCEWLSGRWSGWETFQKNLRSAWIDPPLQVFLLDRLPMKPWSTLSDTYVKKGWQRPAPYRYPKACSYLWEWSPLVYSGGVS
jgi:glycosyltransferase involved in cell wall biosynthesis